jgi:hypothetical protein
MAIFMGKIAAIRSKVICRDPTLNHILLNNKSFAYLWTPLFI